MKLANVNPLVVKSVRVTPEEDQARKITAETIAQWGEGVHVSDETAHYLGEVLVGLAYSAFIAGKAEGIIQRYDQDAVHNAYIQGIQEGKQIEQERRGEL